MKLKELLRGLDVEKKVGNLDLEIKGISDDSRLVKPGFIFVAIKGYKNDGHKFIMEAVRKGAVSIITEEELNFPFPSWIKVKNSREFLSFISHKFYGEPTNEMNIIGITGTNGKTTTSYVISSILNLRGKTGIIGTIEYIWGERKIPSSLTTPFPITLFEIMSSMKKEGIKNIVMEVSSHSLVTERVSAVNFNSCIFTNLTRDHMDFHKSFNDYFKAKLKLIELLERSTKNNKKVIYNIDDPYFSKIKKVDGISFISFGKSKEAKIRAENINCSWRGINFNILENGENKGNIFVPLVGEFNIYNILAGISLAREEGFSWEEIKKGLLNVKKIPGRFEVFEKNGIRAVVDYAHTPDALKNLLISVKKLTNGKVITVFGCGGDRDKGKRKIMGEVASSFSDIVFITSDNPRSEDPLKIINEIKKGIKNGEYYKIPDRGEAIKKAILSSDKGDTVVIAGKGHENYQIWKDFVIPFSDREIVKKELKNKFLEKVKV